MSFGEPWGRTIRKPGCGKNFRPSGNMQKLTQISLALAGLVFTGAACTAWSQDSAIQNQVGGLLQRRL